MTAPYREHRGPYEQLTYSTESDARMVYCEECGKSWREPCTECAEHFAEYHRNKFDHQVAVFPPRSDDFKPRRNIRRRRNWWER